MYLAFFGIAEKPFAITPDPRYLYMSARHTDALAHLVYGISESGGFIQLTGEVGTGKTTTVRSLLARAPQGVQIALILNPRLTPPELLQGVCEELGVALPAAAGTKAMVEDVFTQTYRHVASAYLTFVAFDQQGQRIAVPQIIPETVHQKRRYEDAGRRREMRSPEVARKKEIRASLTPEWHV